MQREVDKVDREIQSVAEVLSRTPDDDLSMRLLLICLANAHKKRFELQHEPDDIHQEIENRSISLTLTPDNDPELPGLLSELGKAHTERFRCLGNKDDMEKAIECKSIALELILESDPGLARQLVSLAVSHIDRFERLGELRDIEKAIEYNSRAVAMTAEDHPDFPHFLSALGASHGCRFKGVDELPDLERAIEHECRVLTLTPDGHPRLSGHLANLAVFYRLRFGRLGQLRDLGQAIEYQSCALALTPDGHPEVSRHLGRLASFYSERFGRLGELRDLEQAIEYGCRALALTHDGDPDMSTHLGNLAASYSRRFGHLGELQDLERAIEYECRALVLTPDGHPDMSLNLSNLAASYGNRFRNLGELRDLEQAIEYGCRALALTPDGHPDLPVYLGNLAQSYSSRFGRVGELRDLEQAIEHQSRALALTPDGHPFMSSHLGKLGLSYSDRFGRLGEPGDLEQAIKYHSRALALTHDGHPDVSSHLANLALCVSHRFGRLGELRDLEQAIEYQSRALFLLPYGHPDMSGYLANLAGSHRDRFGALGELHDLEQAIEHQSRALALTTDGHPLMSSHLGNIALSYRDRFRHLGELRDLRRAIGYETRALSAITSDHPLSCLWHFNHAMSYVLHYNYAHDPSHLHQALPSFRHASTLLTASPRDRFLYARQWASDASDYDMLNPIEAFQATIDLLPQFIWLGATPNQRYHDLKSVQTLAVDAAHAAIVFSNYSLALEWLEHARCIAWNQNLMLRSPLDRLLASHCALATRLQTVAVELHTASSNSREFLALSRLTTAEQVSQDHRRLALEYEKLLTQARTQPGFEDFLRPMKAARLMHAARNGPIVVINCHEQRSDAIMILPGQNTIKYLSLPSFSGKKAQDVHSTIRSILRRKGIRERGLSRRPKPERENDSDFGGALMVLWTDVVKPVLDFLGLTAHDPGAKLPHITWCPTGAASFLPLHAAGDYDQPAGLRVFDYVVSSYTPTLTALLVSTPSTISYNSRVLAVGQANTPGHNLLPGTTAELKLIESHVEGRAGYSELTNAQATPATVLDAMERHDWVHLACHAHQNVHDPTKSGFFLHNGTLDLAAINRRSFKNKGLAFLSACQTAMGDETLPNEAVHLASGMMMAGYSSVIATMWSIGDAEAPFVADKVYRQLLITGTLGNGEAGRALHDAVAGLRKSIGEKKFGRWVPYIHIGS